MTSRSGRSAHDSIPFHEGELPAPPAVTRLEGRCGVTGVKTIRALATGLAAGVLAMTLAHGAHGGEVRVAVATNFAATLARLEPMFTAVSGHRLRVSAGATGLLHAQIVRGAPFDVFLAADVARPQALVASGHARADSLFVYARGRLALCSAIHALDTVPPAQFLTGPSRRIVIANPKLAPYGLAAQAWLDGQPGVSDRVVHGGNVGQAWAIMASGNVDAGIVALSQARSAIAPGAGSSQPSCLALDATPIPQAGVLLANAAASAPARELLAWLRGETARAVLSASGYATAAAAEPLQRLQ